MIIAGVSANWKEKYHVKVRRIGEERSAFYSGHAQKGDADNVATQANAKTKDDNEPSHPAGFEYFVSENGDYDVNDV